MTPEERNAYASKLPNMGSLDECRAYMAQHNPELDKCAKERGVTLPPLSGDPCAVMSTMGRIKYYHSHFETGPAWGRFFWCARHGRPLVGASPTVS